MSCRSGVCAQSALLVLTLAVAGCPPGTTGEPEPERPADELSAVITGAENGVVLGETAVLSAGESVNPDGGLLVYRWEEADVPPGCDVGFSPDDASAEVQYTPGCLGVHRIRLTVSTFGDDPISDDVEVELSVLRPDNHLIVVDADNVGYDGFALALDASGTVAASEEPLSYTWSVARPADEDCDQGTFADANAANTTFTPACPGTHTFTVTAADSVSSATLDTAIAVRASLVVSFQDVVPMPYPAAATFTLEVDPDSVPPAFLDAVTFEVDALQDGATATVTSSGNEFTAIPPSPHLPLALTARARVTGVVSTADATADIEVLNNNPVLGVPDVPVFDAGATFRVTVPVSDADADAVTCAATTDVPALVPALVDDGDPDSCAFDVDTSTVTPQTWTFTFTATDEYGGLDQRTASISPEDESPVITAFSAGAPAGYTCDAGGCSTLVFPVTVEATDDYTAPADLTMTFSVAEAPAGIAATTTWTRTSDTTFDVTLHRTDLGPFAGSYQIEVAVDDVDEYEAPSPTATDLAPFVVTNQAPDIDTATPNLGDIDHFYDGVEALYRANPGASWTTTDAEGNLVTTTYEVRSCTDDPPLPGPFTGCTNPNIDFTISAAGNDESALFVVAATTLTDAMKWYSAQVTVTDADGASDTQSFSFRVVNRAPQAGPLLLDSSQHTYDAATSSYNATLDYSAAQVAVIDPDGDPITLDFTGLLLSCPNASSSSLSSGTGTCGSQSEAVVNDGFISYRTQVTTNIHGQFGLNGAFTDGVATTGVHTILKHDVSNGVPYVATPFNGVTNQNHLYVGAGRIAGETRIGHAGIMIDPNGDPIVHSVVMTGNNAINRNCVATDVQVTNVQVSHELECDISIRSAPVEYDIRATDPFGANASAAGTTVFLNRIPTTFDNVTYLDNQKSEIAFHGFLNYDIVAGDNYDQVARQRSACPYLAPGQVCLGTDPSALPNTTFHAQTDVQDPDGDPVYLRAVHSCGSGNTVRVPQVEYINFTVVNFTWLAGNLEHQIASDGTVLYELQGATQSSCPGGDARQRYFPNTSIAVPGDFVDGIQCTLGSTSYVTDQWSAASQVQYSGPTADVSFLLSLSSTPETCN